MLPGQLTVEEVVDCCIGGGDVFGPARHGGSSAGGEM